MGREDGQVRRQRTLPRILVILIHMTTGSSGMYIIERAYRERFYSLHRGATHKTASWKRKRRTKRSSIVEHFYIVLVFRIYFAAATVDDGMCFRRMTRTRSIVVCTTTRYFWGASRSRNFSRRLSNLLPSNATWRPVDDDDGGGGWVSETAAGAG